VTGRGGRRCDGGDEAAPAARNPGSAWAAADSARSRSSRPPCATVASVPLRPRSVGMSRSWASSSPARTGFQSYVVPARVTEAESTGEERLRALLHDLPVEIREAGLMLVLRTLPGSAHASRRRWIERAGRRSLAASPATTLSSSPSPIACRCNASAGGSSNSAARLLEPASCGVGRRHRAGPGRALPTPQTWTGPALGEEEGGSERRGRCCCLVYGRRMASFVSDCQSS